MNVAIQTENGIEEFNFRNISKAIWEEIVKIPCMAESSNTMFPKIHFRKGFMGKGMKHFGVLGCTHIKSEVISHSPSEIEMFLRNTGQFRIDAFIHELIHARGFRHNPQIGFVTEISEDKITQTLCSKFGLIGETKLTVKRKFRERKRVSVSY